MDEDRRNETDVPDNVIALSKYRARLGRGRRMRRADSLMALRDPEEAIKALPGDELYYLLREDDPREAKELLAYAKPEQIQVVLDFGLWSGDQLMPARMEEWVDVMAEMPFETIGEWISGLDIELVGLLIRKGARIYDLEIEDPPDEPEGTFYATPDRFFVLDVVGYGARREEQETDDPGDADTPASAYSLIRVIDHLYRADLNFARRILVAAKAELDSGLEEMALRWRQGRMADLGFIDAIEALEIYKELDPTTVRIGEVRPGTRIRPIGMDEHEEPPDLLRAPGVLGDHLTDSSLFGRALSRVTSASEMEELHYALVALVNRVLAADRVDPADDGAVLAGVTRMRATLDIGVEFLARNAGAGIDEDRAVDAVRTIPVIRLFRLGVSLIGKVRTLARALTRQGPFAALEHLDLIEDPESAIVAAVSRARPLYSSLLDDPPGAGERPFASLVDVARATKAIERAAVAQAMLLGLGIRPQHLLPEALEGVTPSDMAEVDTALLARTAILLLMVGDDRSTLSENSPAGEKHFRPLTPREATRFGWKSVGPARRTSRATRAKAPLPEGKNSAAAVDLERARGILEQVAPARLGIAAREMADRWMATLSPLEPVLVRPQPSSRRKG